MVFKPGQSGNPKGRTPGRRNAKTRAILEKLDGKADSLALLAEMVAAPETPLALRMHAAAALARYQHCPAPRVLRRKVDLPEPSNIAEATKNIGRIIKLVAQRKLGVDEGNDLAALQRTYIESVVASELEARIAMVELALQQAHIVPDFTIQGGMPRMPGLEGVLMPGDERRDDAPLLAGPSDDAPTNGGET
jgi:hypothetical protein